MRAWRVPSLLSGTTVALTTDLHFGQRFFTAGWLSWAARDLVRLQSNHHGHVITGDLIDWNTAGATGYATEDPQYISWRNTVKATGKPYIDIPGNHDLEDHTSTNTNTYRTAASWASAMGRSTASGVLDVGHLRVIAVVPDVWRLVDDGDPHQNFILSDDQFDWMTAQVEATSRPVVVAAHLPPREHYGPGFSSVQPQASVIAWLRDNPRVIGWLSGHQHVDPMGTDWAKVVTVGARRIFSINAPASAGRMNGLTTDEHQYGSCSTSSFVTFIDDNICEIRVRNHKDASWYPVGTDGRITLNV